MKKAIILLSISFIFSCKSDDYQSISSIKKTKNTLQANFNQLIKEVDLLSANSKKDKSIDKLKEQFKKTRNSFKKCEEFIAFYFPSSFTKINGAPIDENEINETSRKTEFATGFQKVEEILYETNSINFILLKENIETLKGYIHSIAPLIKEIELSDSNIFEIQKLQIIRIMSLGISGFDSAVALQSLPETQWALTGIEQYVNCFKKDEKLNSKIKEAIVFITKNGNFNNFNRGFFITKFCVPIYKRINQIQKELKIKNNLFINAIDLSKDSPFEKNGYNPNYFAPLNNRNPSKEQIALGKKLFFDTVLSGDNTVSCATCHIPNESYADHKEKAIEGNSSSRNTPTLLNAAFQNSLFLDGRVSYLEDQAKKVIDNKDEMHGDFNKALKKIINHNGYKKDFAQVFPKDPLPNESNLLKSIASFIRTLSPLNSKFDNYLQGKINLSVNEEKGFNLFMGKAKCATCHFFPLFNGSVPPLYLKTESEVLGVPMKPNSHKIDPDLGEFLISNSPLKKYAFKTPTVRNSSRTFPYMHNGSYKTLESVIDFYNKGGGKGLNINLENQTLPEDELNLTKEEIQSIIQFINTLNDNSFY